MDTMLTVRSSDDTEISYKRVGTGSPVVLVHGAGADHTVWGPIVPHLKDRFTLYMITRRGRNPSGDASDYALAREVDDVLAVINAIDNPVHLLGHSFGGLIALEAARRGTSLHRLVIYEPAIVTNGHETAYRRFQSAFRAALGAEQYGRALEIYYRKAGVDMDREEITDKTAVAQSVQREIEAVGEYRLPQKIHIDISTLLLYATESSALLRDATRTVERKVAQSHLEVFPEAGHTAFFEMPERFVRTVSRFLAWR